MWRAASTSMAASTRLEHRQIGAGSGRRARMRVGRGGGPPGANWQLAPYHTKTESPAKHLGMMRVRGYFDEFSATADIDPGHPETSSVEVTISTASIRTNNG